VDHPLRPLDRLIMTASDLLTTLGFENLGEDPDNRANTRWIRQTTSRHIVLSLPPDAHLDDAVDAVYDAGRRDQQQHIRGTHDAFARSLRYLDPLTTLPVAK
jgi:hypothetical protein